jgi:hypothetical protein
MLKRTDVDCSKEIRDTCMNLLKKNGAFKKVLAKEKKILNSRKERPGSVQHFLRLLLETLLENYDINLNKYPDGKKIIICCRQAFNHKNNCTLNGLFESKKTSHRKEIKNACIEVLTENEEIFEEFWDEEKTLLPNTKKKQVSNNLNAFFYGGNRKRKRREYESDDEYDDESDGEYNELESKQKKPKFSHGTA